MRKVKLPKALTGQLDNKYHFSKGMLHFTHPTGDNDKLETTEPRTGSDWLRIIGMTLGAVALVAAVVVTGRRRARSRGALPFAYDRHDRSGRPDPRAGF